MREERFIIKVLEMHYKQGLSQREISQKLNVSVPTISRTLAQAKKEGYYRVEINYPEGGNGERESILEERYQLKEALIAGGRNEEEILENVALQAADYLVRNLHDHMVIGLTRGESLLKMIECLERDVRIKFAKHEDITIVPFASIPLVTHKAENVKMSHFSYMVEELARVLGAAARHIPAPEYVVSKELKSLLMEEPSVREVVQIVKKADIGFVGIGTLENTSSHMRKMLDDIFPGNGYQKLKDRGGVGEIISCPYDKNGEIIGGEYDAHIIGISLEEFKNIPIRVGVAYGPAKKDAIQAALKGGLINVLVTDESVAEALVLEDE